MWILCSLMWILCSLTIVSSFKANLWDLRLLKTVSVISWHKGSMSSVLVYEIFNIPCQMHVCCAQFIICSISRMLLNLNSRRVFYSVHRQIWLHVFWNDPEVQWMILELVLAYHCCWLSEHYKCWLLKLRSLQWAIVFVK